MRQISRWFAVTLLAAVHAFAFLYAWGHFGAYAMFSVGSSTNSFIASSLAASFVTAAIATTPLALLAGRAGGKQLAIPSVTLFLAGWLGLSFYGGQPKLSSLLFELSAIALVGTMFYALSTRAFRGRAAA